LQSTSKLTTALEAELTDIREIADELNCQFLSVFSSMSDTDLPTIESTQIPYPMQPIKIYSLNILKQIKLLDVNKSVGPERLYPHLLNEVSENISMPLMPIILSFPLYQGNANRLENSICYPLLKKGNKARVENYCPISVTFVVAKTQKLVNGFVMKHLKLNGILLPSQHGFKPGKSVETNLLKTYDAMKTWFIMAYVWIFD